MVFLVSCGSKSTTDGNNDTQPEQTVEKPKDKKPAETKDKKPAETTDKKPTETKDKKPIEKPVDTEKEDKVTENLNTVDKKTVGVDIKNIYFEFDSFVITEAAQERLKKKYDWLVEQPDVNVEIQGHCDERGTTAYNIALGQKRADRTKEFLINLGIDSSRITTVSYGEEKAVKSAAEDDWAKNRRAYFEQK